MSIPGLEGFTLNSAGAGNPDEAGPSYTMDRIDDSILAPHDPSADTMEIDPNSSGSSTIKSDPPGPSTTYIPRSPSPPLPSLRTERFPPEWDDGEGDDDDINSSDDEVLATLPIYISSIVDPNLQLFQYPLHTRSLVVPSYAASRSRGITARMKEKAGRVEVEVPVDAGQDVWREDMADDYGMSDVRAEGDVIGGYGFGGRGEEDGGGRKKKGKGKEEKRWGQTVRLRSEAVPSETGHYAGVVQDGESFAGRKDCDYGETNSNYNADLIGALHLHPIGQMQQMRTALTYLDDLDEKNRSNRRRGNDDEEEAEKERKARLPSMAVKGRKVCFVFKLFMSRCVRADLI